MGPSHSLHNAGDPGTALGSPNMQIKERNPNSKSRTAGRPGRRQALAVAAALVASGCLEAGSLVVNTTETYQTVDGFGACIISYDLLPSYQDPAFYDAAVFDLGLSILRIPVGDLEVVANDNEDPDNFDWTSFDPDGVGLVMEMARQFQFRGLDHILATPWSPPGWMKTNRFSSLGGRLRPDMRAEFGEFLSTYVTQAQSVSAC